MNHLLEYTFYPLDSYPKNLNSESCFLLRSFEDLLSFPLIQHLQLWIVINHFLDTVNMAHSPIQMESSQKLMSIQIDLRT